MGWLVPAGMAGRRTPLRMQERMDSSDWLLLFSLVFAVPLVLEGVISTALVLGYRMPSLLSPLLLL
jgi:hypothetical protein